MDRDDVIKGMIRGIEENGNGFYIIDKDTWLKAYTFMGRIKVVMMWEGWWYSDIGCFSLEDYKNAPENFLSFRKESLNIYQRLSNYYKSNAII